MSAAAPAIDFAEILPRMQLAADNLVLTWNMGGLLTPQEHTFLMEFARLLAVRSEMQASRETHTVLGENDYIAQNIALNTLVIQQATENRVLRDRINVLSEQNNVILTVCASFGHLRLPTEDDIDGGDAKRMRYD